MRANNWVSFVTTGVTDLGLWKAWCFAIFELQILNLSKATTYISSDTWLTSGRLYYMATTMQARMDQY